MGQRFGFNPEFISWVKLLYASRRPRPHKWTPFCPISPLLWNQTAPPPLATEPLAIRLHPEGGIEGIARAGKDSTLSLYADDLLLYVSHPTPHGSSHGSYYHMWGLFRL